MLFYWRCEIKKIALALVLVFAFVPTGIALATDTPLSLDGIDDYVQIPASDSFNFGTGDFTIETRIKFNSIGTDQYFFAQHESGSQYNEFRYQDDGSLRFYDLNIPSGTYLYSGPNTISVNTWYHIAVVHNGNNWSMYKNSNIIATLNNTFSSADLSAPAYLGAEWFPHPSWTSPRNYLNGALDEFRVWKTARTPEELAYWADRSLSGDENGLVAYYNFNEIYDGIVPDLTRYGNDGHTYGMPIVPAPEVVPEPCTMVLVGLGGVGMAFIRRKR